MNIFNTSDKIYINYDQTQLWVVTNLTNDPYKVEFYNELDQTIYITYVNAMSTMAIPREVAHSYRRHAFFNINEYSKVGVNTINKVVVEVEMNTGFWAILPCINLNFRSRELEFEWLCFGLYIGLKRRM